MWEDPEGEKIRGVVVPSDVVEWVENGESAEFITVEGGCRSVSLLFIQMGMSPGQRAPRWGCVLEILSVCGIDGDELVGLGEADEADDVSGVLGEMAGRIA